jgi:4-hydroxy-tetrahydrodipicolinate reductase
MMQGVYRMLVWGPSGLGGTPLWEANYLESLGLVGVRAFSPDKIGMDLGELIRFAPVGVIATNDLAALFALEAGRKVFPPLLSHSAVLYRQDGFGEGIAQACATRGSTFHATGIDPDLISPGYPSAIAPRLQAIPHVVEYGPDGLGSFGPGLTWRQDLRSTTVGGH